MRRIAMKVRVCVMDIAHFGASRLTVAVLSDSDSDSDEDEIVMPEGPPPGQDGDDSSEEDSDEEIVMPEGPPPPKPLGQ